MKYMILCIIALSCSCNTYKNLSEEQEYSINGVWHLKNTRGGLNEINDDYDFGAITWTFDDVGQTLTVEKNNAINTLYGIEPGTYSYVIQEYNGYTYIMVEKLQFRLDALDNSSIKIIQNVLIFGVGVHGFILEFRRT